MKHGNWNVERSLAGDLQFIESIKLRSSSTIRLFRGLPASLVSPRSGAV